MDEIQQSLAKKRNELRSKLEEIDAGDPLFAENGTASSELETNALESEIHDRLSATKNTLQTLSRKIDLSLTKIKNGTYGMCDKCGHTIENERLKILPTATLCLICAHLYQN